MKTATKQGTNPPPKALGPTVFVRLRNQTEKELRALALKQAIPLATALRWLLEEALEARRRKAS